MAALVKCRLLASSSAERQVLRCLSISTAKQAKSAFKASITREGANVDVPTHTGQVFAEDDYRRMRFIDKEKLVNRQFAINLIAQDPVVVVDQNHVFSNSGGALGHPKVYINLDKPEIAVCGYSGRKFIMSKYYNEKEHGPSILYTDYLKQVQEQ